MAVIDLNCLAEAGPYDIVYVDCPWPYYGDPNKMAAAGKHYNLMLLDEIAKLPVPKILAKKAVVFMWATCPRMPDAVDTMRAWNLHYRGVPYIWIKTTKDGKPLGAQGIPPTLTKPVVELLLAGTTNKAGRPFPILTMKQRQVIYAPRTRKHSEKPALFRDLIVELCGDRPRIELFARQCAEGWDAWGNETEKEPKP